MAEECLSEGSECERVHDARLSSGHALETAQLLQTAYVMCSASLLFSPKTLKLRK